MRLTKKSLAIAAVGFGVAIAATPTSASAQINGLDATQERNARVIVDTVQDRGLPRDAAVVAIATALQETNIRVYANSKIPQSLNAAHEAVGQNGLSVGIFQQQVGPGFQVSSFDQAPTAMDPRWSTNAFLDRLTATPNWDSLPLTVAAQAAQDSGQPGAYAQWEDEAEAIVSAIGW